MTKPLDVFIRRQGKHFRVVYHAIIHVGHGPGVVRACGATSPAEPTSIEPEGIPPPLARAKAYHPIPHEGLVDAAMSALGQEQTCALQEPMSALPPKADMCGAIAHVCFGPKADIKPNKLARPTQKPRANAISKVPCSVLPSCLRSIAKDGLRLAQGSLAI